MLSVKAFRGEQVDDVADPDRLSELAADADRVLWIDLVDATSADLDRVRHEFDLHPLAMEDLQHSGQRPKLELYPTHAYLVAYVADPDPADLPEVDIFAGPNWIVTVRKRNRAGRLLDLDPIRTHFERTRQADPSAGFLLYTILDDIVDGYFGLTDALDEAIEALEDEIFAEIVAPSWASAADEVPLQRKLLDLRKDLLRLRRRIIPMREVLLGLLRREIPWIDEKVTIYLQNVLDHQLRVGDQIEAERELVGNAVDAHLATTSNRVNDIMKKMTSWGAILLGATLIAGIEGMNFEHMPELGSVYGYPIALGAMLVMTISLYLYFRRKGWL